MIDRSRRTMLFAGAAAPFFRGRAAGAGEVDAVFPARPEGTSPESLAGNEAYWQEIGALYPRLDEVVNLEQGNWGAMATPVLAAHLRQTERVNRLTSYYARRSYHAEAQGVLRRFADALGVAEDELVPTRGATESLQVLIGGYNRLRPGDAVLYADLDYDSMQAAMRWLRRRRGVEAVRIALPEPATRQGLVDAYARTLESHPKVKLVLLTHVSHRTGLVLPVREIVEMARVRGVDAIVDAAHSWGQLDFRLPDLGADFVGLTLHKWIGAPLGVGLIYIRRERVGDIDPFMEDTESGRIEARVHTGTADFAAFLAAGEALRLHLRLGPADKEARLRYLRSLWTETLRDHPAFGILVPPDPGLGCAIASFRFDDLRDEASNVRLARELLERFRIFTVHRTGVERGACIRVTPGIQTPREHVEHLIASLEMLAG